MGFKLYQRAFETATGKALHHRADISGRTELDTAAETLRSNGIEPTDTAVSTLTSALTWEYEAARDELGRVGRVLPGAAELVSVARQRAIARAWAPISATVLIGDTPNDVRAAIEAGARVIGVASGKSNAEELETAGADSAIASLEDGDHIRRLVVEDL